MKSRDSSRTGAFVLVGIVSVSAAFLISLKFLSSGHAQDAANPPPSPGAASPEPAEIPAEERKTGEASELEGFLEPFIYDIVNRRDPFMPYADYVPEGSGNARPLSPAQRFDLEQLKLIGIMWDVKDPKALFMDPESEVLPVGLDDGIGRANGYIAAIREGEVVVVEAIRKRGDVIYKTKVLRLDR